MHKSREQVHCNPRYQKSRRVALSSLLFLASITSRMEGRLQPLKMIVNRVELARLIKHHFDGSLPTTAGRNIGQPTNRQLGSWEVGTGGLKGQRPGPKSCWAFSIRTQELLKEAVTNSGERRKKGREKQELKVLLFVGNRSKFTFCISRLWCPGIWVAMGPQ